MRKERRCVYKTVIVGERERKEVRERARAAYLNNRLAKRRRKRMDLATGLL